MESLIFLQARPTQVDAPLFRALHGLHVPFSVFFRSTETPLDTELGTIPNFGTGTEGYEFFTTKFPIPRDSHLIVGGWNELWTWGALLRARGRRVNSLGIRFDSVLPSDGSDNRSVASRLRSRRALRLVDVWHPTGPLSEQFARSVSGVNRPSVPIPYQVGEDFLVGGHADRSNVDGQATRALAVSKLNAREGVLSLVQAMAEVSGIHLTIVGDGPDRPALERLASTLNTNVEFVGYIPYGDLIRFYDEADIYVHPAIEEPWGVSVQEAMARGLPVIASDRVGAATSLIGRSHLEWRFEAGDVAGLRDRLLAFRDPHLRAKHASSNLNSALRHSPEATARSLASFLQNS